MAIAIRQARDDELEALIPILLLAEQSERALRWGLANLVVYIAWTTANTWLVQQP